MSFIETSSSAVVGGADALSSTQFFSFLGTSNPEYLIVCALDRNEYTAAANGDTGSFSGDGNTLALSSIGGDGDGAGIVYTWQASADQYENSTYGALSGLTYTASDSVHDMTDLSLFSTSSLNLADDYASNAYALMQTAGVSYIGSVSVVTDPAFSGTPPAAATPDGIAAVAAGFVGDAWNMDGCWVLASTIAAEAGASLPVQSTALELPGKANGEWIVAYNGPVSSKANWASLVHTGEIVAFVPAGGGGHITTCVSGSGSSAELIDNITYEGASGILNSADDGSASDILVSAAHPASQEFAGANPADAVIYELDTPVVNVSASLSAAGAADIVGTPLALTGLVSAADPAGKAITRYQLYDSLAGASFVVAGVSEAATSAGSAVSVGSLSGVTLSYTAAGSDVVDVRAFNGTYWGDWTALTVTVSAFVPAPPRLGTATANQTWKQGSKVALALPATLFTDPQKHALTYSASGAGGAALPGWLSFNPVTRTLSGTVPSGNLLSVPIVITATDTLGLSASESFVATVPAAAPTLVLQTGTQSWLDGAAVSFALPAGSFADPQGEALTLTASLSNGTALPSWLSFNPSSGGFSGTAPLTVGTLALKVTATDSSGLSVADTFTAALKSAAPVVAHQTPAQTWAEGGVVADTLSPGVFADPLGETLTLKAALASGAALPSWLSFSAATATFSGTAPASAQALSIKVTATDSSGLSGSESFVASVAKASTQAFAATDWSFAAPAPAALAADTGGGWSGGHDGVVDSVLFQPSAVTLKH